jgi:hypothetical protein
MRLPLGPEFAEERERFAFRFCCEDCAHRTREGGCAHYWPQQDHRTETYADPARREIVFCKEFELA